ncbi:MAG: phosphatase PAP2 family protein [Haloarculaceae archaeon]
MTTHGVGLVEVLESLPDPVVVLFALLTQLGDLWFYFLVLSVLYFFGDRLPRLEGAVDRRRAAYLVALVLGAAALTATLKGTFLLQRPPGAGTAELATRFPDPLGGLYVEAATADGYGFPSGHATSAAVVWVGAATVLGIGRSRVRYAVAGTVTVLIALSRVVIGVHFAADVVVGLAVGLCYLAIADRASDRGGSPGRAFSLAVAVALVGLLLAGFDSEPVALLGATLGARIAWGALGSALLAMPVSRGEGVVNLAVGLPVFGGLLGVVYVLEPAPTVAFLGAALSLGGVIATPLVGEYVGDRL